ncbi:purine-cytosine permease family protein [Burkholderia metallica]
MKLYDASSTDGSILERRSIDPVPDDERHGGPLSQFTLWLSANLTVICAVTGALTVVAGGDVFWSLVGLFIGQLAGGAVMALHGAQGPQIGMPQMILSRVQFGVYGAIIPLVLVCIMYIGFLTGGAVLTGHAVGQLLHVSTSGAIVILGVLVALLALFGYRTIHALGRAYSVVGGLMFAYLFVNLLRGQDVAALLGNRHFTWPMFLFAVSLSASWQISYGPYVADYSRYLPRSTSPLTTFVAVGAGSVLGSQIAMTFGVFAAAIAGSRFAGHEVTFMVDLGSGGVAIVALALYLAIMLGKLIASTLCVYGGVMSVATIATAVNGKRVIGYGVRVLLTLAVVATYTIIALAANHGFLKAFSEFILFLLAFFTPWSAINLVDYYCVSREFVDVAALSDVNGRYGKWNVPGIAAYVVGVLVQIPFVSTGLYTGPLFHLLGGVDVSWIVGIVIPGSLYYFITRTASHTFPAADSAQADGPAR